MTKMQYGVIKATPLLPSRDLVRVPHEGGALTASWPPFGPNCYWGHEYMKSDNGPIINEPGNIKDIQKAYFHSKKDSRISFREPTTSESISIAAYRFNNLMKPFFGKGACLQLGWIVRTPEGVFANPPKESSGLPIMDENILKSLLNGSKDFNGIYLCDNGFGFAPNKSFKIGFQDSATFSKGGLARLLENSRSPVARKIKRISSPKNYPKGISNYWNFRKVEETELRVVILRSDSGNAEGMFGIEAYGGGDPSGYTFGILESATKD